MKKLTKKTARKIVADPDLLLSLHEAVCLAMGYEPEGERPEKPTAEYLEAERYILREVPLADKPEHLTNRQWQMQKMLEAAGATGENLEQAVRSFGDLPEGAQDMALAAVRARFPTVH